jgi:molybdopterin molybdotransferase
MVQLSDDCFTHGARLVTVAEAVEHIEKHVRRAAAVEYVSLRAAARRVLACDVIATMNLPPHGNSAVDGYAFAYSGLSPERETVLSVGGRVAAGRLLDRRLRQDEAIRIFTGAPMPDGADTVIMQEDCIAIDGADGQRVRIQPGIWKGANHRSAGEDVAAGAVALSAGRRLLPADLGLAAALGRDWLPVFRRLRVALLSTGDEVCDPGKPLPPAAIYDSNRVMLAAWLEGLGCVVDDFGICSDRPAMLAETLSDAAIGHDLIVTSGAVSTGEEDHIRGAIERVGTLHFWRLAIKPGKPVALGQIGGVPLIGLPGNPVAVFVTFAEIARPLILRLAGADPAPLRSFPVRAGFAYRKKPGRRDYLRALLERDHDGLVAIKYPRDGSAILSSIVQSDGLVVLDEYQSDLAADSIVDFIPFVEALS